MPIVGQFGSLAGFGVFPGGALESIATVTVGSGGASSITFSDIPSGFQHLQLRYMTPSIGNDNNLYVRLNSSASAIYTLHALSGDGGSAAAGGLTGLTIGRVGYWFVGGAASSNPTVGIMDLLDYASTTKTKVARVFSGNDSNGSGAVRLESWMWNNTSAVTSVSFANDKQNLPQNTIAALYGVRA